MLITFTVEICIQQLGRGEEMVWLLSLYDAGLSAAAETLVGILVKVIVSPAVYPRFLEIAELETLVEFLKRVTVSPAVYLRFLKFLARRHGVMALGKLLTSVCLCHQDV